MGSSGRALIPQIIFSEEQTMEVSLRNWQPADAPALAEILSDGRIRKNLRDGIPFPYTVADAEQFLRDMREADPERTYAFAVLADGKLAGIISVTRGDNVHRRTGELGYYLGAGFWGRGIGTSAVRQMCGRIFYETDIIRIFAEPFAHNTASCRVLEKAGFSLEGVLRRNAVKEGRILDMKLYALLKEDFFC